MGGWNCDHNQRSRDALVIIDGHRNIVGTPWRGNLRNTINQATTSVEWLQAILDRCQIEQTTPDIQAVLSIDTPLGFSQAFTRLVSQRENTAEPIGPSQTNPYLYRQTARYLFDHVLRPLSSVKDMIGSQATKGMHVLAKFGLGASRCGVWSDGKGLTAIEAYPAACKDSLLFQGLLDRYTIDGSWLEALDHQDKVDALICALVGHTFYHDEAKLAQPPDSIPISEGWIWVPQDGLTI